MQVLTARGGGGSGGGGGRRRAGLRARRHTCGPAAQEALRTQCSSNTLPSKSNQSQTKHMSGGLRFAVAGSDALSRSPPGQVLPAQRGGTALGCQAPRVLWPEPGSVMTLDTGGGGRYFLFTQGVFTEHLH